MRRKESLFVLLSLLVVFLLLFAACGEKSGEKEKEKEIKSISVQVPDKEFIIGEIDYSEITLIILYDDDSEQRLPLNDGMITRGEESKLSEPGAQSIQITYQSHTTKMSIKLAQKEVSYCSLSVYDGYVSAVNGKDIVSPVIPNDGEFFTDSYPMGTELTIHWKDKSGMFFDYWTINDIRGPRDSLITITLTADVVYRAYSSTVTNTVSFVTYMENAVVASKTTDVLNEIDIEPISGDGYVFLGWTTDNIDREKALSGYENRVVFPYMVTRDTIFYAVWTPIEIVYSLSEEYDGYVVESFSGNVQTLVIPETHAGKPVVGIAANAFDTKQGRNLTGITLPTSIRFIGDGAFGVCDKLKEIKIAGKSDDFILHEGVLYSADLSKLIAYPAANIRAEYIVSSFTEYISEYAFNGAAVGRIVLSSRLTDIGKHAFDSAHIDTVDFSSVNPIELDVEENIFNEHVRKIVVQQDRRGSFLANGEFVKMSARLVTDEEKTKIGVFSTTEADGKTSTTLYRVISDENFENNGETAEVLAVSRDLAYYTLQNNLDGYAVTSIAENAFAGCTDLISFKIPISSKLERICDDAFSDTPWIKTLTNGSIIANSVFYKYFGSEKTVTLNGIVKIAEGAFSNNKSLVYIDISANSMLKSVCAYAFCDCNAFRGFICEANPSGDGVYLRKDITKIGAYAFKGTAIRHLKIQEETATTRSMLRSIGKYAFANCAKLLSITLSSLLEDIEPSAFVGSYSLQEFILKQPNALFEVYDGILYKKINGNNYSLYSYPAGRIDSEFNIGKRMNYATAVDKKENAYLGADSTGMVGEIYFNGNKYALYMGVSADVDPNYLLTASDNLLRYNGRLLTETTSYSIDENGRYIPNGEKYLFCIGEDEEVIYLLYDDERKNYYYSVDLNVVGIGEYSLQYANVAAVYIPDTVRAIASTAFNTPGLLYVRFDQVPMSDYKTLFGDCEPEYVVIETVDDLSRFFGNDKELEAMRSRDDVSYEFHYGYNEGEDRFEKSVLYAYDMTATGSVTTSVVRTDRTAERIIIPDSVKFLTDSGVTSITSKKNVFPYAFYGEYLETVFLRNVQAIMSNAFSEAKNLTKLDLNTAFISQLGNDVFGDKLNNGLYIYDFQNGIDLYRGTEEWKLNYTSYEDQGEEKWFSEYLITSDKGAFAVIMYQYENAWVTYEEKYSELDPDYAKEIGKNILKKGYIVDKWVDGKGVEIPAEDTYEIEYNQILKCIFVPKRYTIYIKTSPTIEYDYEQVKTDETGLTIYKTEVVFDGKYGFIPTKNSADRNIFFIIETNGNNDVILPNGEWNYYFEEEEITLRSVFGYKVIFDVQGDNITFVPTVEYLFNGDEFEFGVPESIDGSVFVGWYYVDENGSSHMLTGADGKGTERWSLTLLNEYTVFAKWER